MVFGGARFEPETEFYLQAERLGELLGRAEVPVITGGGQVSWRRLIKAIFRRQLSL